MATKITGIHADYKFTETSKIGTGFYTVQLEANGIVFNSRSTHLLSDIKTKFKLSSTRLKSLIR